MFQTRTMPTFLVFFHPGTPLFNVSIKTHFVLHMGLISSFINPGLGSCWMGEDLMRTARSLIASSSTRMCADGVQLKAMDRHVHALGFDLQVFESER